MQDFVLVKILHSGIIFWLFNPINQVNHGHFLFAADYVPLAFVLLGDLLILIHSRHNLERGENWKIISKS